MKILTKEEEQEHYNATLKGGVMGGAAGLAFGALGVYAASRRYPAFRGLTLPFRAFLVSGSGTFSAIIAADSYSRNFEKARNPEYQFQDESESLSQTLASQKTSGQRAMKWASDNRYSIVFASWVASMGGALAIVGRSPHLTGQQKLVQARVYAQGLTMAVVIASLALEGVDSAQGKGRWETVRYVDPNDPEHKKVIEKQIHHEKYKGEDQWMDMVAAEEERLKEREEAKEEHAQKVKKESHHKEKKEEKEDPAAKKQEEVEKAVSKSKKANVP
ncbi:hypothetical protein Q7P36_009800 [Cladosporium allicinum]